MRFLDWITKRRTTRQEGGSLAAQCLRRGIKQCKLCGESLHSEHSYVFLASVIATSANVPDVTRFNEAIRSHSWAGLKSFFQFDGRENNFVAYLIKCPQGGGLIAVTLDPFELYANPEVYAVENVSAAEMPQIQPPKADWIAL